MRHQPSSAGGAACGAWTGSAPAVLPVVTRGGKMARADGQMHAVPRRARCSDRLTVGATPSGRGWNFTSRCTHALLPEEPLLAPTLTPSPPAVSFSPVLVPVSTPAKRKQGGCCAAEHRLSHMPQRTSRNRRRIVAGSMPDSGTAPSSRGSLSSTTTCERHIASGQGSCDLARGVGSLVRRAQGSGAAGHASGSEYTAACTSPNAMRNVPGSAASR